MLVAIRQESDDRETFLTKAQVKKMRDILEELVKNDVDLEKFYLKNLFKKSGENLCEKTILNQHCISWLYTVRCEIGFGGLKYIENCLWRLKYTLDRELEDIEFEYTKLLLSILFELRNLYK